MTNKAIAIVVVLLLVAGAGYWWYSSSQAAAPDVAAPAPGEQTQAAPPAESPATPPAEASPPPQESSPQTSPPPAEAKPEPPPQRRPDPKPEPINIGNDPLERCLGSRNAPIRIEVFSDYQCPACRQYYLETIQFVLQEYATVGKVCVVYYELPLERIHPHAREAARFGLAARLISPAHWVRVSETIYSLQGQWAADGKIEPLVANVLPPADMEKLRGYKSNPKLDALIDHDIAQARSRGVTGTPTSFLTVNGQTHRINGPVQYAIMKQFLDKQLGQ